MTRRLDIAKRNAATAQQALDALRALRPSGKSRLSRVYGCWASIDVLSAEHHLAATMALLHRIAAESVGDIARRLEWRGRKGIDSAAPLHREERKHRLASYRERARAAETDREIRKRDLALRAEEGRLAPHEAAATAQQALDALRAHPCPADRRRHMTHITQPSAVARLLSAQEVAALLHRQPDWFYKHRRRLEALGFPRPVPDLGRRWDPAAIRHWLDKQAGLAPASPAGDDPNWGRRLDARLAALPIDPALRA